MAVKWNCDICGKVTHVNPPMKPVFKEDGKTPEVVEVETMNFVSGAMEKKHFQKMEDLAPRCHIIKVNAGQYQSIQRDFCGECLKQIEPELNALWRKLADLEGK